MAKTKTTLKEICERINNGESFENLEVNVEKQESKIYLQSCKNIYDDVIKVETCKMYFSYAPDGCNLNIKIPGNSEMNIKTDNKSIEYSYSTGQLSIYKKGSNGLLDKTIIENIEEADLSWQYNTHFKRMGEK